MYKRQELQKVLIRLWHVFAELEQVFYLVQTGSIFPEEKGNLIHLIDSVQEDLYPIIRYEKIPQLRKEIRYREPVSYTHLFSLSGFNRG